MEWNTVGLLLCAPFKQKQKHLQAMAKSIWRTDSLTK